jgi:hypothetical protein
MTEECAELFPPLFQRVVHTDKTPDEIMDAAADIIDARGWTRGVFYNNETGGVCTYGAIRLVVFPNDAVLVSNDYCPELIVTMEFMRPPIEGKKSVPHWNDNYCENSGEAADFLRSEAKRYREQMT